MDKKALAEMSQKYFFGGYNCAQAVVMPFKDILGISEDMALKTASSFGGGVGKLREICGAVTGMAIVAGLLYGYTDPFDGAAKAAHYRLIQDLAARFNAKHKTLICRELLDCPSTDPIPTRRTKQYYESRPCAGLVKDAVRILCEMIEEKNGGDTRGFDLVTE